MLVNGYRNRPNMPTMMHEATLEKLLKPISTRVVSSTPGRLRLRVSPPHRHAGKMNCLVNALKANHSVNQVRTNVHSGSITIAMDTDTASQDKVFNTLRDLGIIFTDLTDGKSEAAADLTNAVFDLNKQVKQATNGVVDLRLLFPLGLSTLAVRQLLNQGLQFELIPWYVLAWYAFDSFIKLHYTTTEQSTSN